MKVWALLLPMAIIAIACTTDEDTEKRDGYVCLINPAGEPQSAGNRVEVAGDVCVETEDGETICGQRRNLAEQQSDLEGCFRFLDAEQKNVTITYDGECFVDSNEKNVDLTQFNPWDIELVLDPDIQCWEADNRIYYPVCSQYLAGNDPALIAYDKCCDSCAEEVTESQCCSDCMDTTSNCCIACGTSAACCDGCLANGEECCVGCLETSGCCENCAESILPDDADIETLRLGNPDAFKRCCADFETKAHQPNQDCGVGQ